MAPTRMPQQKQCHLEAPSQRSNPCHTSIKLGRVVLSYKFQSHSDAAMGFDLRLMAIFRRTFYQTPDAPPASPSRSDHPEWVFEPKMDGRVLAHVEGRRCSLVSRNGHTFKSWPQLGAEIAQALRASVSSIESCLAARVACCC